MYAPLYFEMWSSSAFLRCSVGKNFEIPGVFKEEYPLQRDI